MAPIVDGLARAACRRQPAEAPDLAQEALIACLDPDTLRGYGGRGSLRGYLRVVAHWRILSIVRTRAWSHRQHQQEFDPQWAGSATDPPVEVEAQGAAFLDALADALVDEPARVELILRAKADGMTDDELAAALDCPPGTIKSTWHRARRRLASKLGAWEQT